MSALKPWIFASPPEPHHLPSPAPSPQLLLPPLPHHLFFAASPPLHEASSCHLPSSPRRLRSSCCLCSSQSTTHSPPPREVIHTQEPTTFPLLQVL